MSLNTQTLDDFVTQFIAAWAQQTGVQPVPNSGSPIVGIADATAQNAMFLQYQAQQTTFFARLQTCTGPDVDSFCMQFNFPREGAQFASGDVTLSIPLPAVNQLTIPIGSIIQTNGANIQYQLVADTDQVAYNAGLQAYVLDVSATSITASVQALVAGSVYNVQASQLTNFGSSSYGFTTVTNVAPIVNGADQESDAAYKARFETYIQSLSKGTFLAILAACQGVFPDFTYTILNNTTPGGTSEPGWFTVIANNPGETVSSPQLAQLQTAVNLIRAFTIQSSVIAAIPVTPLIQLNVAIVPNAVFSTVQTAVQTAIIGYVNSLPTGAKLYLSNLVDVAENASSLITSVEWSSVTIGGFPLDFTPGTFDTVVQANVNTVLIGQYGG
jgi:uncharacterized phage protein gp47/JayE